MPALATWLCRVDAMLKIFVIVMAIATACTCGHMGARILLFGLVKPEDVDPESLIWQSQSAKEDIVSDRKAVRRSVLGRRKDAASQ